MQTGLINGRAVIWPSDLSSRLKHLASSVYFWQCGCTMNLLSRGCHRCIGWPLVFRAQFRPGLRRWFRTTTAGLFGRMRTWDFRLIDTEFTFRSDWGKGPASSEDLERILF